MSLSNQEPPRAAVPPQEVVANLRSAREFIAQQASRKSRHHLLAAIDYALDALLASAPAPPQEPPCDWFNQVCAALGLFDGARAESKRQVLWNEVLPAIEALKSNNPEAGVLVRELQRVSELWRDALGRLSKASAPAPPQEPQGALRALRSLTAEVTGLLGAWEQGLRQLAGHTNVEVLRRKWSEARAVLDGPAGGAPAAEDERSSDRATAESTGPIQVYAWLLRDEAAKEARIGDSYRETAPDVAQAHLTLAAAMRAGAEALHPLVPAAAPVAPAPPPQEAESLLSSLAHDQAVRAKVLRRCAEEIENARRNRHISLQELIDWYRAQADNMDPERAQRIMRERDG